MGISRNCLSLLAAVFVLSVAVTGCGGQGWMEQGHRAINRVAGDSSEQRLSDATIGAGLKEALKVGTAEVVERLGQTNGFFKNPEIHIPLPDSLSKVQSTLHTMGASFLLDDLELRLNRAAERATPVAKELFWQSIREMTFRDVRSIYNGPQDAATQYFRKKMSERLGREMRPVIEDALSQVGAVRSYERVMDKYTSMPFVPDAKANLVSYTVDKSLEGVFTVLAREEAAIRNNPAKQSTELLRTVFGKGRQSGGDR
ncbi:MAG: DUF4197 domain-containing protein [Desulfohalobiaceae bacterium]